MIVAPDNVFEMTRDIDYLIALQAQAFTFDGLV